MAKKIASVVLTVISYLLLIVGAVGLVLYYTAILSVKNLDETAIVLLIAGVIVGAIGHFLIWLSDETFSELSAGYKAVYILSFLPFLPILIFVLLWGVIKRILQAVGVMAANQPNEPKKITVYTIRDESGFERKLVVEKGHEYDCDYKLKDQPHYARLVDDLGRHWRSYDNFKTFIRDPDTY